MGINKDLGLPFGKMQKVAICFDVDGTLIEGDSVVHNTTLRLLRDFLHQNWKNLDVIVWSGGGADYARVQYDRITRVFSDICPEPKFHSKLEHKDLRKKYTQLLIIDDIQDTALGDVNLIVRNK